MLIILIVRVDKDHRARVMISRGTSYFKPSDLQLKRYKKPIRRIEGIRGHLGHSSDSGSRQSKQRVSSSSTHGALFQKDASQGQNPDTVNMWEAENMSVASQGATGGSFNGREETVERPLEGRLCQCAHIMRGHRKMSSKNRDMHLERKFRKPGQLL